MEPFIAAFKTAIGRYADFSGRTSIGGYWRFWAVGFAITVVTAILSQVSSSSIFFILYLLVVLGLLIPNLAAAIRRLHDTGKPGIYLLIGLIPCVGLVIIYFLIQPSDGPNAYGAAAED